MGTLLIIDKVPWCIFFHELGVVAQMLCYYQMSNLKCIVEYCNYLKLFTPPPLFLFLHLTMNFFLAVQSRGLVFGIWSACGSVGNIVGAFSASLVLTYGYEVRYRPLFKGCRGANNHYTFMKAYIIDGALTNSSCQKGSDTTG